MNTQAIFARINLCPIQADSVVLMTMREHLHQWSVVEMRPKVDVININFVDYGLEVRSNTSLRGRKLGDRGLDCN